MTDPRVTLHDVRIEGDVADEGAVLAAIELAVARAVAGGAPPAPAVSGALKSLPVRPGPDRSSLTRGPTQSRGG